MIPLYQSAKPTTPEEHLEECRSIHQVPAPAPVPVLNRQNDTGLFTDCSWPPVPGADRYGFTAVELRSVPIPDATSAEQFTEVIVLTSRCAALLLQFKFVSQGSNVQEEPLLLANDQVVSAYDGSFVPIPTSVVPQIGPNSDGRLVVLVNSRYELSRLACTDPAK